jgi:hypothetical protein
MNVSVSGNSRSATTPSSNFISYSLLTGGFFNSVVISGFYDQRTPRSCLARFCQTSARRGADVASVLVLMRRVRCPCVLECVTVERGGAKVCGLGVSSIGPQRFRKVCFHERHPLAAHPSAILETRGTEPSIAISDQIESRMHRQRGLII